MLVTGTITHLITVTLPDDPGGTADPPARPAVRIDVTTDAGVARHEILGAAPHRWSAVLSGAVLAAVAGLRTGDRVELDAVLLAVRLRPADDAVVGELEVVAVRGVTEGRHGSAWPEPVAGTAPACPSPLPPPTCSPAPSAAS